MRYNTLLLGLFLLFLASCASQQLQQPQPLPINWGENRVNIGTENIRAEIHTSGQLDNNLPQPLAGATVRFDGYNTGLWDHTENVYSAYNVAGISFKGFDRTQLSLIHWDDGHDRELFLGVRYTDLVNWLRWIDFGVNDDAFICNTRLAFDAWCGSTIEPSFEVLRNWDQDKTPGKAEILWFFPSKWLNSSHIRPFIGGDLRVDDMGESFTRNRDFTAQAGISATF